MITSRIMRWMLCVIIFLGCTACNTEHRFVKKTEFKGTNAIVICFAGAVDENWVKNPSAIRINEQQDPDILLKIERIELSQDGKTLTLIMKDTVNQTSAHQITLNDIMADGKSQGTAVVSVKKLYWGNLLSILIGAIFVQNYVFVKYLGLCVYLGVTQKKSTAIGMGITFTIVIIFSTSISWFLYQFILKPFQIEFLQIIVFIGLVSLTVQAVDTILRKVNPILFKEFGVYLVLIISSCLILAVPLIMAAQDYDFFESLMLSAGAGLGFFIAMFLMSCVRERIDLAPIPESYQGMPIAFIVSGLFALSFMGFSGMSLF
ncbi:Electron transport complex, Rnf/Nqr [Candidatus Magnetomorum sp. HK-1]|nr:Electron transport complex, Rnf/Nqr [Candidatus Magnetomorum sp. HK-1]